MRECESLRNDLKAYLDGELSPFRRAGVRMHLSQCASCREEMTAMENIGSDLRAGDAGALDPSLKAKILAGVADVKPDPAAPIRDSFWRRNALPLWAGAAAVVVLWFVVVPIFSRSGEMARVVGNRAPQAEMKKEMGKRQAVAQAPSGGGFAGLSNGNGLDRPSVSPSSPATADGPPSATSATNTPPAPVLSEFKPVRIARNTPMPNSAFVGGRADTKGPGYVDKDGHFKTLGAGYGIYAQDYDPHDRTATMMRTMWPKKAPSGRYVKKGADITVEVDRLEEKSDAVEQMVKEAGGYVANNQLTTGEDDVKSASLTVKVPVPQFETMLSRFAKLGDVKAKNVTGEDITEQVSDEKQAQRALNDEMEEAKAQLAAARSRTQKRQANQEVKDLKVEIAQAEGRLELLKKEAALSTITIQLREKSKRPLPTGGGFLDDMGDTGRAAVNSFVQAARLPFVLLIWILAYAPVWIPLAIAYRYAMRAHRLRVAVHETKQWQAKWSQANPESQA